MITCKLDCGEIIAYDACIKETSNAIMPSNMFKYLGRGFIHRNSGEPVSDTARYKFYLRLRNDGSDRPYE